MKLNHIYNGNSLEVLQLLPEKSINMCITSPPYWGQRDYGTPKQIWGADNSCNHDWIPYIKKGISGGTKSKKVRTKGTENFQITPNTIVKMCSRCEGVMCELGQEPTAELYVKHICDIFNEVKRVLKDDGTCWVNIGDKYSGSGNGQTSNPKAAWMKKTINRGTVDTNKKTNGKMVISDESVQRKSLYGIPFMFALEMIKRDWILRNNIIWRKPGGMPSPVKDRFTIDYEYVFFFSKNPTYYFKQQFTSTSNKPANMRAVWDINTEGVKSAHFAVFPTKLVRIPIRAGCPDGGTVLDPFMGSGTTAIETKKQDKNFVGIELNPEYIKLAWKRISKVWSKRGLW